MVQFTLPKNSKVLTGKTWPKPEGKNVRLILTHRKLPTRAEMVQTSGGWHTHASEKLTCLYLGRFCTSRCLCRITQCLCGREHHIRRLECAGTVRDNGISHWPTNGTL